MTSIIDLVGSTILGAAVIAVFIGIVVLFSASNRDAAADVNAQETMRDFVRVVNSDFAKIGNKVSSNAVLIAKVDTLKFRGDIDNNGTVDTVTYMRGTTAQRTKTPNPRDFMLYRKVSTAGIQTTTGMNVGLTKFTLSYVDSTGTATSNPVLVRGIVVAATLEDPYSTAQTANSGVSWQNTIYPRNINLWR